MKNHLIKITIISFSCFIFSIQVKARTLDSLRIGDNFQGGIIGYILKPVDLGYDSTLVKGVIVAPFDQPNGPFGCIGTKIGTSFEVGTGASNTARIINGCSSPGIAARICDDLILNGYDDWFLPSYFEFYCFVEYLALKGKGNFDSTMDYQTSTEADSIKYAGPHNNVLCKSIDDLYGGLYEPKNWTKYSRVRAARYFSVFLKTTTDTACYSYMWRGKTYGTSGIYQDTIDLPQGVDSIFTLKLKILGTQNSYLNEVVCDSFKLNDQVYYQSGSYKQNLFSKAGCDSIINLNLQIKKSTSFNITETACEKLILNGQTYLNSGTYNQFITNSAGCDSIITLHLTIKQPSKSTVIIEGCDSVNFNQFTYKKTGVYYQSLKNEMGCDSLITLNVQVNETPNVSFVPLNSVCWNSSPFILSGGTPIGGNYFGPGVKSGEFDPSSVVPGNYTIHYFLTVDGCSNSDSSSILVSICTGVNNLTKNKDLVVFPNPTTGIFSIQSELKDGLVIIKNTLGENIFTVPVKENGQSIDLSSLSNGIYFLIIKNNTNFSATSVILNK